MRSCRALAAVLALVLVAAVAGHSFPEASAAEARTSAAKKLRPRAFSSCTALVRYGRRHLPVVTRRQVPQQPPGTVENQQGAPPPSAAPAPRSGTETREDSSTTNVQEQGVDEPDIVKSDGSTIFAVAGDRLHAVDARASTPQLLDSLRLEGFEHQLLLHSDRLVVISRTQGQSQAVGSSEQFQPPSTTVLTEVKVGDPAAMRVVRTLTIDGAYVSARATGRSARVVISSRPRALDVPFAGPAPPAEASPPRPAPPPRASAQQPRRAALRSRLAGWMPSAVLRTRRTGRARKRALVACGGVRRPATFSGLDMLTVLTIDLAKGLPAVDSDALMTDGQHVYASAGSLYVATERWLDPELSPDQLPRNLVTAIHGFDISDPDSTRYRASGRVPGFLLNQFSMSEHRGSLRVATTSEPVGFGERGGRSESFVSVLRERAGQLVEVGRVAGLGKGEQIFAVRFIDDVGFVVTFRQTDPLYTIDLSSPTEPKVLGELKIRGYSAYLHPIGGDLLLGVGQDATQEGRRLGTQVSLFDVGDLRNPVRLHQRSIGDTSSSEVEYDHHAFLYWAPTRLAVLPVEVFDSSEEQRFSGAVGFRIERDAGIGEVGRVSHGTDRRPAPVRRSLVVGDRLITVSDRGLMASDLGTLGPGPRVAFPASPQDEG